VWDLKLKAIIKT